MSSVRRLHPCKCLAALTILPGLIFWLFLRAVFVPSVLIYMFSVRSSNFDKYAHFWHYVLVGKSLQKVMLLQKRTPIVVWIVKPTMAAARLPLQCCLLALANQHSAKMGSLNEVKVRTENMYRTLTISHVPVTLLHTECLYGVRLYSLIIIYS